MKTLALAACLLAAWAPCCTKESGGDGGDGSPADDGREIPIVFSTNPGVEDVKGVGTMTTAALDSFGVFAAYTPEGGDPDGLDRSYMMNVPYRRVPGKDIFDTQPERYWPVAGSMTFFALAPYDRNILDLVDMDEMRHSVYPTLEWGPDPDPKKQIDICVAVNKGVTRRLEVPLEFHHATSQVYFAANYITLADNEFLIIDSVIVSNIIGSKKVSVIPEAPYVEWEPNGSRPRNLTYRLSREDGTLKDLRVPQQNNSPRGDEITAEAGRLFLVPQTYDATSAEVELTVAYTQYFQRPDLGAPIDTMRHTVLETVMPACVWEPDKKYRLLLSINDKTQWLHAEMTPEEYTRKDAEYYAMTCSFRDASLTKVEGDVFELVAVIGPENIIPYNKEVQWTAEPSDYVKIEYKAVYDGRVTDPADVTGMSRDTVMVTCLAPTSAIPDGFVTIRAQTVHASSPSDYKTAELNLTIDGVGLTIAPYPSGPVAW